MCFLYYEYALVLYQPLIVYQFCLLYQSLQYATQYRFSLTVHRSYTSHFAKFDAFDKNGNREYDQLVLDCSLNYIVSRAALLSHHAVKKSYNESTTLSICFCTDSNSYRETKRNGAGSANGEVTIGISFNGKLLQMQISGHRCESNTELLRGGTKGGTRIGFKKFQWIHKNLLIGGQVPIKKKYVKYTTCYWNACIEPIEESELVSRAICIKKVN